MYPVVCTTLLRVLDCWEVEGAGGSWLRADTSVECSSGQHQTYQVTIDVAKKHNLDRSLVSFFLSSTSEIQERCLHVKVAVPATIARVLKWRSVNQVA